ncbi:MAG: GMC family oxidoreductase [Anaerolineae bacterium]|nr:GMC family oxidoreductase [Anaerolineae bacterium]
MAIKKDPVDAVVVGMGWAGGIMAKELAQAGLTVVGLERGPYRNTAPHFQPPEIHDELRYARRHGLMQNLRRETNTFRNNPRQRALPMRQWAYGQGAYPLGEGLGGSGVHWNGQSWRFLPWDFETRSRTVERYGEEAIPPDATIQDWGITYDDLEPYYDKFEYAAGISGQAGNLQGQTQEGGNPFEGPRQRDYPLPPLKTAYSGLLFWEGAERLGYHPFPSPAGNQSQAYTNPDGVAMGRCLYCGFCSKYGCEVAAKSSPLTTVLPVVLGLDNFQLRTHANVIRVNLDDTRTRAVSVTYVDAQGREIEQPADIIVLAAYALNNVRLLLLSGIGQTYDPMSGEGLIGKNYSYQFISAVSAFFEDRVFNPFMSAGAMATVVDDFNGDNFDHTGLGFIGGGFIAQFTGEAAPINTHPVPLGTPPWGSEWKRAAAENYRRAFTIITHGAVLSYRNNYLDLDPTYRDAYGQPLLRMTFNWTDNELRMADFLTNKAALIAREAGASDINIFRLARTFSIVPGQATHNNGGAIMGADPATSVVNPYLQMWDVPNLFVVGASAFPQNTGYNPTETVGALAYWTADAIRNRYLKNPGPLA